MADSNRFTVFEHEALVVGSVYRDVTFTSDHLQRLEAFFEERNFPYYKLIRNGVRFGAYVGVLQIGPMVIEVLPKADQHATHDYWRKWLINMLLYTGAFRVHAPSSSQLTLKTNAILDLYVELFVSEVEYLLHRGLVKRYRPKTGNSTALKGALQFSKHLQQNLVHQERFFVRYTTYDAQHRLHQILYKTIRLLRQINTNASLQSRIGALLLHFPPMPDLVVNESVFEKLAFDRKDEHYASALDIARLLLLNYHPDVSGGRHQVLALMFDMNLLWERFVYRALRRQLPPDIEIREQAHQPFWRPTQGDQVGMKPDIVIRPGSNDCIVLDTKWKKIEGQNPSPEDLRQLYAYQAFFNAQAVALVYPGQESRLFNGRYQDGKQAAAAVLTLACPPPTMGELISWQQQLADLLTALENWSRQM